MSIPLCEQDVSVRTLYHGGCWEKPLVPGMEPYLDLSIPEDGIPAIFLSNITPVCKFFALDRNPDMEMCRSVIFKVSLQAVNTLVVEYDPANPRVEINGENFLLTNDFEDRLSFYQAARRAGYQAVEIQNHYHFKDDGENLTGSDIAVFDSDAIVVESISQALPGNRWTEFESVPKAMESFQEWSELGVEGYDGDIQEANEYADFSINY